MADMNNLLGEPESSDPATWPQLRSAAATWTSAHLAEQIQRTGPFLHEDLQPDEAALDHDPLPDFEAEP